MPVLFVILIVALIGLACWGILKYIPMADPFPKIIIAVAVIGTVIWLLSVFGLLDSLTTVRIK